MVKIIIIIINKLLNNQQLIQKLADSYPMRRAAQLLISFYQKHLMQPKKPDALEFNKKTQLEGLNLTEKLRKIVKDLEEKNKRLK